VSENCVSGKKLSGDFDLIDGKLYLYSYGGNSKNGAKNGFWQNGGGPRRRIPDGVVNWIPLKQKLENGSIVQPDSKKYKKSAFE
jgi:hypothetical protein